MNLSYHNYDKICDILSFLWIKTQMDWKLNP